jgi:ABC-type Fe3+/spermidine/putrescine transport system ATPase subunit
VSLSGVTKHFGEVIAVAGVDLDETVPDGSNRIEGTVARRTYYGDVFYYDVDTPAGRIEAKEENRPGIDHYEHGDPVIVVWHRSAMSVVKD